MSDVIGLYRNNVTYRMESLVRAGNALWKESGAPLGRKHTEEEWIAAYEYVREPIMQDVHLSNNYCHQALYMSNLCADRKLTDLIERVIGVDGSHSSYMSIENFVTLAVLYREDKVSYDELVDFFSALLDTGGLWRNTDHPNTHIMTHVFAMIDSRQYYDACHDELKKMREHNGMAGRGKGDVE